MHELSIALDILDIAAAEAERHGSATVAAIHVRLGPLSGVVKGPLQSAFELARELSTLPEAKLVVEEVPLIAYCPACAAQRTLESPQRFCCPGCGGAVAEIVSGRQLEVVALELEP